MKSGQKRFVKQVSTQPGPGEYNINSTLKLNNKKIILENKTQNQTKKNPPSIPSKNQTFGYETDNNGKLLMQNNPIE